MTEVVVTGMGLVSALGGDLSSSWKRLLAGESAIAHHQPFPELSAFPLAMVTPPHPANLAELTQAILEQAIADGGLTQMDLRKCGVCIGSSRGEQGQWEQLLNQDPPSFTRPWESEPSGQAWLNTLPHRAAVLTAQRLHTQGPVFAPMNACATGLWAIAQGAELIRTGECDRVVAGAVEAPITRLSLTGFDQMGALATTGAYPFDRDRQGLVLGEGGAILVLERRELAVQRGTQIYGQILGWGLTTDAYHLTAPAPSRQAALTAIHQCLQRSGLGPEAIQYIHAHGTATQLNDANEAALITELLGTQVWVSSSKGAIGHTLGGSGAIGTAFSLMALRSQLVPPNVGLSQSAFGLNFVRQTQPATLNHALVMSFGFGGQNAILALGQSLG